MATDQARHLPIAMVVVVEQAHLNDVLIAVTESPLCIQTTQIAFQHVTIKGPKPPPDPAAEGNPRTTPGAPVGPLGTPLQVEEDDPNLLELTIYGIATLYERPKPKEAPPPLLHATRKVTNQFWSAASIAALVLFLGTSFVLKSKTKATRKRRKKRNFGFGVRQEHRRFGFVFWHQLCSRE